MHHLLNQDVTIEHRAYSGTNDHGAPSLATTSTETVKGYLEQQRSTSDASVQGRQDTSRADWLLILPAGTAIDHTDRVTVDGTTFEVIDIPWSPTRATTGLAHHVELVVREVQG